MSDPDLGSTLFIKSGETRTLPHLVLAPGGQVDGSIEVSVYPETTAITAEHPIAEV
jgi:hypothetical protein